MNLHVPQTEEARTEAEELMLVQEHIRSPRYGGPIVGCIQDHISGNYLLTEKERKFSKEEAIQLLNKIGIEEDIEGEISGKELFSYLLPRKLNISFKSSSCRGCETCKEEECPYDEYVKIKNGKLKMGVIDKNAIGRDDGILLGAIEREFGSEEAKDFLNRVSRLGIEFLDKRGFTIGVSEMDISNEARDRINETIQNARKRSQDLVEKFEKEELEQLPGQSLKETLETKIMKSLQNALTKTEEIISESIPENHSTIMARSGARGSTVNLAQLAGFVGLETLQGEMIHRGYKNRTLPNFKRGDLSPKAHGFVTSSFKQGLNPFEFFFDAMNGREGLMDKSLRTRHSGYMERRLVNALQDLKIEYDGTIRDNRRRIIQFVPGEDFIDPAKSSWGSLNVEDIVKSVTS